MLLPPSSPKQRGGEERRTTTHPRGRRVSQLRARHRDLPDKRARGTLSLLLRFYFGTSAADMLAIRIAARIVDNANSYRGILLKIPDLQRIPRPFDRKEIHSREPFAFINTLLAQSDKTYTFNTALFYSRFYYKSVILFFVLKYKSVSFFSS